ncbi:MAG: hypothetical protein CML61_12080 [Rhodobacteraceae bacterium]|nr:hypothetical protein [Paracoccaceae bacterium]
MARRYGGRFSPQPGDTDDRHDAPARLDVDPVGGRANLMFLPPALLTFTSLGAGPAGLVLGLAGAGVLAAGAWVLRAGLTAEAAFHARRAARPPAVPRKILAAAMTGTGTALAAASGDLSVIGPVLYGLAAAGLHVAAFGIDPLRSKGMEGVDTFQHDRVARVVEEAEALLASMSDAVKRAGDRTAETRLARFQNTARDLIRVVEEDPRDLTAARKYLVVYLRGARDATVKFADIYARSGDAQAKADYLALLDDLDENFAARTRASLLEDRGDLTVEIDVLRERLAREGVHSE